jgi:hypothetical protein
LCVSSTELVRQLKGWYGVKTKSECIPVSDGIKDHMLGVVSYKGHGTTIDGVQGVFESQGICDLIKFNGINSGHNYERFQDGSTLVKKFGGKNNNQTF